MRMKKHIRYRVSKLSLFAMLLVALVGVGSCQRQPSNYRNKKKIKKGKPLPCPQKDC